MLILPKELMTRELNPASWENIGAETFNGRAEDTFKQTTLHLSFTEYTFPIFDGTSGGHDVQVSFVESLVSVHDRGTWVGDVDILGALDRVDDCHLNLLVIVSMSWSQRLQKSWSPWSPGTKFSIHQGSLR